MLCFLRSKRAVILSTGLFLAATFSCKSTEKPASELDDANKKARVSQARWAEYYLLAKIKGTTESEFYECIRQIKDDIGFDGHEMPNLSLFMMEWSSSGIDQVRNLACVQSVEKVGKVGDVKTHNGGASDMLLTFKEGKFDECMKSLESVKSTPVILAVKSHRLAIVRAFSGGFPFQGWENSLSTKKCLETAEQYRVNYL
jgi:hypothetical protein